MANPAAPAPTITTSTASPALPFGSTWSSRLATWSPWRTAFRRSPIPPSSPTMWIPGLLDSKNSSSSGRSTPRSWVPMTSRIAWTGHSAAHLPWPMQWSAWTSVAVPFWMPRMSPSGQAFRQEREPMQMSVSMTGWSDRGMWRFFSTFSWRTAASRSWRRRRVTTCVRPMATARSTAMAAMTLETRSTPDAPPFPPLRARRRGAAYLLPWRALYLVKATGGPVPGAPLRSLRRSHLPLRQAARAPAFLAFAASALSSSQMVIGAAMNQVE